MRVYVIVTESNHSVIKVSCSYFFTYSYSFSIQDKICKSQELQVCLYDTSDCTVPQELDSKATICSNS